MVNSGAAPSPRPIYNPFLPETRINPYPIYQRLREADPVNFNPYAKIWFLTRHRDCQLVLRDPRFSASQGQAQRVGQEKLPETMLNMDPPDHTRLRQPFSAWFTPRRVQQFHQRIEALSDQLIDRLLAQGGGDLLADFAEPFSLQVLMMTLGVEPEAIDSFRHWSEQAAVILDPLAPTEQQQRGRPAAAALSAYFAQRIIARRSEPGDDFISVVLPAVDEQGVISEAELLSGCTLMVVGGYEPLIHVLGNGVLALLQQPEQLRLLREDPSLLKTGVEELIRFDSPIQFAARVATEDIEFAPHTVERGQAVIMLFGAANRDPEVFPNPDQLDVRRSPNPQLGFGSGPHICMGAPLVRMSVEVALSKILQRLPNLALASDQVNWRPVSIPRGLSSLPVKC